MDNFEHAVRLNPDNEDAHIWIEILEKTEGFTRKKLKPKPQKIPAPKKTESNEKEL